MEIKKCPFCNSECEMRSTTFGDSMTEYYCVECKGNDAHCLNDWQDTEEEAINVWNQRAYVEIDVLKQLDKKLYPMTIITKQGKLIDLEDLVEFINKTHVKDVTKEDDIRNKTIKKWKDVGLLDIDKLPSKEQFCQDLDKILSLKGIGERVYDETIPDPPPCPKARRIHNGGFTIKDKD